MALASAVAKKAADGLLRSGSRCLTAATSTVSAAGLPPATSSGTSAGRATAGAVCVPQPIRWHTDGGSSIAQTSGIGYGGGHLLSAVTAAASATPGCASLPNSNFRGIGNRRRWLHSQRQHLPTQSSLGQCRGLHTTPAAASSADASSPPASPVHPPSQPSGQQQEAPQLGRRRAGRPRSAAARSTDGSPKPRPDEAQIRALARSGQWERALELLEATFALPPSQSVSMLTFEMVLQALANAECGQSALRLFETMRSRALKPSATAYNRVLGAVMRCRLGHEIAEQLLEDKRADGHTPTLSDYKLVMTACSYAKAGAAALRHFRDLRTLGLEPDVVAYSIVLGACGRSGLWREAFDLMTEVHVRGLPLDVRLYNSVMFACALGGEWQRALRVLREMPARGVKPNATSYHAAMQACTAARQWEEAANLVRAMAAGMHAGARPAATAAAPGGSGGDAAEARVLPTVECCRAAAAAAREAGQEEVAREMMRIMHQAHKLHIAQQGAAAAGGAAGAAGAAPARGRANVAAAAAPAAPSQGDTQDAS